MENEAYYVSDVTGTKYPKDNYHNHGWGGLKYGKKDLPHDEYPYSVVEPNVKSSDEVLVEFMREVFCILKERGVVIKKHDLEYDARLYKALANWMINVIPYEFGERGLREEDIAVILPSARLRELAEYVEFTDLIDFTTGKRVLGEMLDSGDDAWTVMTRMDLLFKAEGSEVDEAIDAVLAKYPDKVVAYKGGKSGLLGMFVGEVMRSTKGVNGKEVQSKLTEKLK
tara:strand:- start:2223 stop:2900 length:678 start_codon:yes stop_codon:yes gene_type:complete